MDWAERARQDLRRADQARAEGNEGRARVCARRAAGWAAKAYLEAQGVVGVKKSGFENILQIRELGVLTADEDALIEHLTASLEKDDPAGESYWPEEIDLVADARRLIGVLYPGFGDE